MNNSQKAHPEDEVDRHIIPLIKKQILDINQTNITDKNVNSARKMPLKCIIVYKITAKRVSLQLS